jgi:hypothetical protein
LAEVDRMDVAGADWSNLGASGRAKRSSVMVVSAERVTVRFSPLGAKGR